MKKQELLEGIDQFNQVAWNKNHFATTAQAAGMWYSMFRGAGSPPADTILGTGANLTFQALTGTTSGASPVPTGGNAGKREAAKRILKASAWTAASTTAPCVLMLVDLLGFYNITTVTATGDQALVNTVAVPRYPDGNGVRAFVTPSTVMGAATPDIEVTYTNSAGTAGQKTPAVLPAGLTAAPVTSIVYSGTGAGKYGPFLPLAAGDQGMRSIQQFNLSASYLSGVLNLVLCKPLLTLNISATGVAAEKNFVDEVLSMPVVKDGACLAWLMYAGANTPVNSALFGTLDFGW